MNNNNSKYTFVSDFDGTISNLDFFSYARKYILTEEDMQSWEDYKNGKITHIESLKQIFAKIRIPEKQLGKVIDKIELDTMFLPTYELCKKKGIEFVIASAGSDYYINKILERINLKGKIELVTNPSKYSETEGLQLFPYKEGHKYSDYNLGVSKENLIKEIKSRGKTVLFAGDGRPDIEAASVADIVFAKSLLIEMCEKQNIKHKKIISYKDIYNYIQNC